MNQRMTSIVLGTALVASAVFAAIRLSATRLPGNQQGYEPVQPIAYSHRLHAGELQIECLYCHSNADKSRHAGIPAARVCMNCHSQVTASFGALRAEDEVASNEKRAPREVVAPDLKKLYNALGLNAGRQADPALYTTPIAWVRVHKLPDFVYFDHRAHVNAGVVCQQCHGPVETMERVRQVSDLSMGWCVNCHRELNKAGVNGKRVDASIDCSTCHF
jgi:hypothetical protein